MFCLPPFTLILECRIGGEKIHSVRYQRYQPLFSTYGKSGVNSRTKWSWLARGLRQSQRLRHPDHARSAVAGLVLSTGSMMRTALSLCLSNTTTGVLEVVATCRHSAQARLPASMYFARTIEHLATTPASRLTQHTALILFFCSSTLNTAETFIGPCVRRQSC